MEIGVHVFKSCVWCISIMITNCTTVLTCSFDKNCLFHQTNINLTESLGIFLRVQAGLDIVSKKATWELQSLDPSTGNRYRNISFTLKS